MASFRLNKVAKDFNVGIQTLVDHLAKKGHQVEQNPNTKISEEQYDLLAAAFQGERKVKEEADKIELMAGTNQVVEAAPKETHESENDEVIIKGYTTAKPVVTRTPKPVVQPEAEKPATPVADESTKADEYVERAADVPDDSEQRQSPQPE